MSGKTAQDWYNEARTLLNLCKHQEALAASNQAISLKPDYLEAIYLKGVALYLLKNYEEATKIANQITKLDPKDPRAYSILGLVSAKKKEFDQALELYDKGISIDPSNPHNAKVFVNKGNLYLLALNDEIKAIETFHEAIKADPTFDFSYTSLGNALYELRRYEEAIEYYDKAYKTQASACALTLKAECLVLVNKKKEAINVYIEAYRQLQAGKPGIGLSEEKIRFLENEIKRVAEVQEVSEKCKQNAVKCSSSQEYKTKLEALQRKKDDIIFKIISKDSGATGRDMEGILAEFGTLSNDLNIKSTVNAEPLELSLENGMVVSKNKKAENQEKSKDKVKQATCCNLF